MEIYPDLEIDRDKARARDIFQPLVYFPDFFQLLLSQVHVKSADFHPNLLHGSQRCKYLSHHLFSHTGYISKKLVWKHSR